MFKAAAQRHGGASHATCDQIVPGHWSCTAVTDAAIQQAQLNVTEAQKSLQWTIGEGGDVRQAQIDLQQAENAANTPQPDLFASVTYSSGRYQVEFN